MRRFAIMGAVLWAALSAGLRADQSDAWAQYNHLKDDSDAYVGEGIAKLEEFGGDPDKAQEAARQRAKADLAGAIKVQISSVNTESIRADKEGVSEQLSSKSSASSDLSIENVKTRVFIDLPALGKVTVLAYVTKEDYRRQLAGKKVSVYLPEYGLKLMMMGGGNDWENHQYNQGLDLGIELMFKSFILGVGGKSDHSDELVVGNVGGVQQHLVPEAKFTQVDLGYNWTPWALRLQPFVPLRLHYQHVELNLEAPYPANEADLFGASAGLGLRFWPSDFFALEATISQGFPFNKVTVNQVGYVVDLYDGGPQFDVGLLWSGF
jgi:hypothetical protein